MIVWNQTETTDQLPEFDENGNLPSGEYSPSEEEFEIRFVRVESSATRPQIYEGWQNHLNELQVKGLDDHALILLNGSYVTNKIDAGDIDLAVEISIVELSELSNPEIQKLLNLLQGNKTKSKYFCDAYPVIVLPESHPEYDTVTKSAFEYWLKWFGTDRNGNQKGHVWSTGDGMQ